MAQETNGEGGLDGVWHGSEFSSLQPTHEPNKTAPEDKSSGLLLSRKNALMVLF